MHITADHEVRSCARHSTMLKMTPSTGWKPQRLLRSQNEMKLA